MTPDALLPRLPMDLGDGLILRLGTVEDAEAIVVYHRQQFDEWVGDWSENLTSGHHPTTGPHDYTLVVDQASGKIISTIVLISQTWAYGGVPFGVGRPEIIHTDEPYRRRGLVRRQMELIHEMSAARGQMMQGITGIPNFYRQFGYEMCLNLYGGRLLPAPRRQEATDKKPTVSLRAAAGEEDCAFIRQLHDQVVQREIISGVHSVEEWAWLHRGCTQDALEWDGWAIIQLDDQRIGYYLNGGFHAGGRVDVSEIELLPDVSLLNVVPDLVNEIPSFIEATLNKAGETRQIRFLMGGDHRIYPILDGLSARTEEPSAWYVRIPDLPGFLRHVVSALERHLAASPSAGYTGELTLSFYRSGLRMVFDNGRIPVIEDWDPYGQPARVYMPDLTFLQVICGRRRFSELAYIFEDCWSRDGAHLLLDAMFPRFAGQVGFLS